MRSILLSLLVASQATPAAAQDLIQRFLARDDRPLVEYASFRRLEARNERFKAEGWVEACVALDPRQGLSFRIVREGGSGYIRNKVLKKALETERESIASGGSVKGALSLDNYVITRAEADTAPTGEGTLLLSARRKDQLLINGRVVVSDPEADLLRIEGRLVKSPSFWTRSVDLIRRYARKAGVRVPVEMASTAEVRIAGRSHFRMSYDYLSINGVAVAPPEESAAARCLVTQN